MVFDYALVMASILITLNIYITGQKNNASFVAVLFSPGLVLIVFLETLLDTFLVFLSYGILGFMLDHSYILGR